jgi:putative PEP-CTERM system TPR-repeat lipoprotein
MKKQMVEENGMRSTVGRVSAALLPVSCLLVVACLPLSGCAEHESPSPGELISTAEAQYTEGNYREAVIALKNALQIAPEDRQARFLLGKTYLKMGRGEFAEKELRRAQEGGVGGLDALLAESLLLQGKHREVIEETLTSAGGSGLERARLHALRGNAYALGGDTAAASREYDDALALEPDTVEALVGRAAILGAQDGDAAEARTLLERAVRIRPDHTPAWAALGQLEQREGRLEAAEAAYGKAIEHSFRGFGYRARRALIRIGRDDLSAAEADIAALRKIDAKHPDLAYVEGRLYFRQGKYAEAEQRLKAAERSLRFGAVNNFYLGAAELALGHFEQAVDRLGRYYHDFPGSANAGLLLARARMRIGDLDGAHAVANDLLRAKPDDPGVLRLMAQVKTALNDQVAARGYLQRAAELQPDSSQALADLGSILLRSADEEEQSEGIETLGRVLALDPSNLQADVGIVAGHLQKRDYDKALEAAEAMQGRDPDSPQPWTLMGIAYGAKGDLDRSRAAFEKALEMTPGEPSAASNMAALAMSEGKTDEARSYYRQILEHSPDRLETLLAFARLEASAGDTDAFLDLAQRAVAAHPDALAPRMLLARYALAEGKHWDGIAVLKEIEDEARTDPDFLTLLGWLQLSAGESASAVRSFAWRAALEPDSAEAMFLLANANASAGGNADQFEEALLQGLRLAPRHPMGRPLMAVYLTQAGSNAEKTKSRVRRIREIDPKNPDILYYEADRALQRGDTKAAFDLFSRGARQNPGESRWVLALADLLIGEQRGSEAVAMLADWSTEHPKDKRVMMALGLAHIGQGNAHSAIAVFAELAELAPDDAAVLNDIAWSLRTVDSGIALGYAEQAVELTEGESPATLDTLGMVLAETGEVDRAVEVLQKAVDMSPSNATIVYHYAVVLETDGQRDRAEAALQRVLSSSEQASPGRGKAESMLERLRAE